MEVKSAEQSRKDLIAGQQSSSITDGSMFPVVRIYLDKARSRYMQGISDCYLGSGVKSFWVSNTNDKNFVAKIVPNPKRDRNKFSGLPLKYNSNQKFRYPVDDCCIEFESQPGVWIDISFSESEDIDVGFTDVNFSGTIYVSEGSSSLSSKVTSTSSVASIIPASSTRTQATLQNKGSGSVWVGNNTAGELQHADWKTICHEIPPNGIFVWKNSSAYFGKSDADADLSLLQEFK